MDNRVILTLVFPFGTGIQEAINVSSSEEGSLRI